MRYYHIMVEQSKCNSSLQSRKLRHDKAFSTWVGRRLLGHGKDISIILTVEQPKCNLYLASKKLRHDKAII